MRIICATPLIISVKGEITVDVLSCDRSASSVPIITGNTQVPGVVTEIVFATQALVFIRFASILIFVESFVSALEQDRIRCVRPPVGLAGGASCSTLVHVVSNLAKDLLIAQCRARLGQNTIEGLFWLHLLLEERLVLVLVCKLEGLSCCHMADCGNCDFVHCLVCLVFVINFAIQCCL